MSVRVLVVDDMELFRSGVTMILRSAVGIEVVGEASNGREAHQIAARIRPDVALVDLKMPICDGVELTRELAIALPTCRVLVLTTFENDDLVFDALRAGATGYLLKDVSAERLTEAIHAAAEGRSILAPSVATKVLREFVRLRPTTRSDQALGLSRREREIVVLLARGATNKEIAAALHIAEGTVKNHVTHILEKLGVTDRTRAAIRAHELGLL